MSVVWIFMFVVDILYVKNSFKCLIDTQKRWKNSFVSRVHFEIILKINFVLIRNVCGKCFLFKLKIFANSEDK